MKNLLLLIGAFLIMSCSLDETLPLEKERVNVDSIETQNSDFLTVNAAPKTVLEHILWQTTQNVTYDPRYYVIKYPMGDVPANKGVCVDVPIRALRVEGIDLQELVHEDVKNNLAAYNLKEADSNIDHRRCVNLIKYFKRQNQTLTVTSNESDYKPGDLVFWKIARGHVGVVSNVKVPNTNRYYIVHNICCGPQLEDMLFAAPITAHVRLNLKSLNK